MSLVLVCEANAALATEVSVGLSVKEVFILHWVKNVSRIIIVRKRFAIRRRRISDKERIQNRQPHVCVPSRRRCPFIRSIEVNFALQRSNAYEYITQCL